MASTVALIPARGGSQRIPRKNIRDFLGVPALARVIGVLASTGVFDRVVVSTDDEEISQVAKESGADVPFRRPAELADSMTGARPVIQHAINTLELADDTRVGVFYPTAVMTRPDDVTGSLELLQTSQCDFVLSVSEFPAPIERALTLDEDAGVSARWSQFTHVRSQDLTPTYFDTGQFYWGTAAAWRTNTAVVSGVTKGYVLDSWRTVDIDTPDDWVRAELLYRTLYG